MRGRKLYNVVTIMTIGYHSGKSTQKRLVTIYNQFVTIVQGLKCYTIHVSLVMLFKLIVS